MSINFWCDGKSNHTRKGKKEKTKKNIYIKKSYEIYISFITYFECTSSYADDFLFLFPLFSSFYYFHIHAAINISVHDYNIYSINLFPYLLTFSNGRLRTKLLFLAHTYIIISHSCVCV